jgi:hypothetical protein
MSQERPTRLPMTRVGAHQVDANGLDRYGPISAASFRLRGRGHSVLIDSCLDHREQIMYQDWIVTAAAVLLLLGVLAAGWIAQAARPEPVRVRRGQPSRRQHQDARRTPRRHW